MLARSAGCARQWCLPRDAIPGIDDHDGHPSIRSLVEDGYEVITL